MTNRSGRAIFALAAIPLALAGGGVVSGAGGGRWTPTPLPVFNAKVTALAIAPSEPARLYLGAEENGIYRTDNRGDAWTHRSTGLPSEWAPREIAISPVDADEALAGGADAVFRTTNGGTTWEKAADAFAGGVVEAVTFLDGVTAIRLAGVRGGAAPGIKRSTDGGMNWSAVGENLGAPQVDGLAVHPTSSVSVLAATSAGVAKSTDAGVSWTITDATPMRVLSWSASASRIYGITETDTVCVNVDGGEGEFAPVGLQPLCGREVLATSLTNEMRFLSAGTGYCGPPGPPVSPISTWVRESLDGGENWSQAYRSPLADVGGSPLAIVCEPVVNGSVYLGERGDYGAGVLRRDSSAWHVVVAGVCNYSISAIRGDDAGGFYALWENTSGGLVQFHGAGEDSEDSPCRYRPWNGNFTAFHSNERTPGLLFQAGNYSLGDLFYRFLDRSTDGGGSWQESSSSSWPPSEIATNHGIGQFVYARESGYFDRSEDWGETFVYASRLPGGDPLPMYPPGRFSPNWTVLDSEDPAHLFSIDKWTVYESIDGAENWEPRGDGLPEHTATLSPFALFMRAADATFLQVVYSDGRVFRTTNGGNSWAQWSALALRGAVLIDATWDPETGHVFAATSGSGVVATLALVSAHAGEGAALPDSSPTSVYFSPPTGLLYVGTSNAGLYHQQVSFPRSQLAPEPLANVAAHESESALRVSPNPLVTSTTIDFALPLGEAPAPARVDIFDLRGKRVRVLESLPSAAPEGRVTWNGRDTRGNRVAAGIYFVRVASDPSHRVEKIVVLR